MEISALISAVAIVIVSIIEAIAARDRRRAKQRFEDRARESHLAMKMMDASLELGLATAIAVEKHQANGEMKTAKKKAEAVQEEYQTFVREITARELSRV